MPEMFTDRATNSNCTKRFDIKMNSEQITIKNVKLEKPAFSILFGFVTSVTECTFYVWTGVDYAVIP